MIQKVAQYIANKNLLQSDDHVLVALSGGADSVALLHLLHSLNYRTTAAHCNVRLRGIESDRDEQFCRTLCLKLGIPLMVQSFDTTSYARQHGISIEMAARQLRYDWFEKQRTALQAQAIAVAHHRDDQAETLLLNLVRGSGLRGLTGMKPRNGSIVRPLLCTCRADILAYLADNQQDYITDSTNLQRDALRNIIRLDVVPLLQTLNSQAVENIVRTSEIVRDSLPYYQRGVDIASKELGIQDDCTPLKGLDATMLHEWLQGKGFNRQQEQEMLFSRERDSGKLWISDSHEVLLDRQQLILRANEAETPPISYTIEFVDAIGETGKDIAYLDADKLDKELLQRTIQPGDRFVPFGMKGSRLVSDYLTDRKYDRFRKAQQQVLCCGEDIVWVIGERSDNRYRVTDRTRRIAKITLNKNVKQQHKID